ncbi:helix-turn-helix domain-containing protein [Phenylobacterium zucineum]|uniref:helix-turn-helix domain-containing protein n=1 Tax=Phenylobacterium zucineum TaxID=284016 RepID=UPI000674F1A7|nr:AraC family transcriptional regulator [Phenylobacterium zucineum]
MEGWPGAAGEGRGALQVPLADLQPLLALAQSTGAGDVPARFGLSPDRTAADAGGTIPLTDYFRFWRAMKQASREETLYLSARPLVTGTSDFVISDAARTATLADGMERIARAYNLLHGGDYNRVERHGRALVYFVDDAAFPYAQSSETYIQLCLEGVLLFLHATFCTLAGEDLTPMLRRVHTRRPAPRDATPLALWDAPVTYGAAGFGLTYDAAIAARPLTEGYGLPPDHAVHNRLIALIEARQTAPAPAASDLARRAREALADGFQDQAVVARRLGVSVATLRRRLAADGTSFRGLRREVLNGAARDRLAEGSSVGDVAEALGFSDCRSFTRAFKAWNGVTPSGWRERNCSLKDEPSGRRQGDPHAV